MSFSRSRSSASSSSVNPTIGDLSTAVNGMSCLGLSKIRSMASTVCTSTAEKYPVADTVCAGMPSSESTFANLSAWLLKLRNKITTSEYDAFRSSPVFLSVTSCSSISFLMRSAINFASSSRLSTCSLSRNSSPPTSVSKISGANIGSAASG